MDHREQLEKPAKETSPVPVEEWQAYRLPELATNGFPFSPTFILPESKCKPDSQTPTVEFSSPFGFHFWRKPATANRPIIDLTKGYYDPHTQVYTIPLRAGGDTDGGVVPTGSYTYKGDGAEPTKEWDVTDDKVTD